MENTKNIGLDWLKFSLNRNQLKYIAIIAMICDHLAWKFIQFDTPLGIFMYVLGRLTAPCMCFFVAEGFFYTRNKIKYGIRLALFAVVSWIPFHYFETGTLPFSFDGGYFSCDIVHQTQSMIYTLFLCFVALCFLESDLNIILKIIAISCVCFLDLYADWHVTAILMTLVFYVFKDSRKKQALSYSILATGIVIYKILRSGGNLHSTLFQAGLLLFAPIILFYNGEKESSAKFHKWFFYIFYPAHLLLFGIIKYIILK